MVSKILPIHIEEMEDVSRARWKIEGHEWYNMFSGPKMCKNERAKGYWRSGSFFLFNLYDM